jgi:cyclopropane-fatty-acyl-phospholipid synthase
VIDRAARAAVLGRLGSLRSGRLKVTDPDGARTLGAGETDLRAAVQVRDGRLYRRAATGGSVGVAAAYLDGWWEADDLVRMLRLFARDLSSAHAMRSGLARALAPARRLAHAVRRNTRLGSRRNIAEHYDLGNDLFALFLDETMTYSSGVFPSPDATLEESQVAKLDRLCRKIDVRDGDRVLEIGSGWGSFAVHAASTYGCRVTTVTISKQQHALARQRVRDAGLADRVEVKLADYRDLIGTYDKLVSIEMIEAVGHVYLPVYFRAISRLLEPDGAAAIQAITMPDDRYERYLRTPDFIQRFVFPGSCCPSHGAIASAVAQSDLRLAHAEDLTPHYAETLARWRAAFNENLDRVRALGYPPRFERLWNYYLAYCEAGFAERAIGLSQLVYHKPGRQEPVPAPAPLPALEIPS